MTATTAAAPPVLRTTPPRTTGSADPTWTPPRSVGVVLPNDRRVAVTNATVPPYRWIGQLECSWRSGPNTVGTATLIDDRFLITCAHNLFDTSTGQHMTGAVFRPALTRNAGAIQAPFHLPVDRWVVPEEYRTHGGPPPPVGGVPVEDITDYLYDYGVVRLRAPAPAQLLPPMFQPYWPGAATVRSTPFTITGYSGDLDDTACTQYRRSGSVSVDNNEEFVAYRMSTYHGDSGAPIYAQLGGRPWLSIVGVHVTGVPDSHPGANDGLNFGPAFTMDVLTAIQDMIAHLGAG